MRNLKVDRTLFLSETLEFEVRYDDPQVEGLVEDAPVVYEGVKYYISQITKTHDELGVLFKVEAEAGWMRLADVKKLGAVTLSASTPANGVTTILENTSWSLDSGGSTTAADTYYFSKTDASVLDLLWQWAKATGYELDFDTVNRKVAIIDSVGATKVNGFRYGRNVISITRTSTPPKATRIWPYGQNGLGIGSVNGGVPYLEDYTYYTDQGVTLADAQTYYRKDEIYVDESFQVASTLLVAAQVRLDRLSQPSVKYEADVVDLRTLTGLAEYEFELGDQVPVYDSLLGVDIYARVTQHTRYPLEPHKDRVVLTYGDYALPDPSVADARSSGNGYWALFRSSNGAALQLRNGGTYIVARIPLEFSQGGEAVYGLRILATGVGAGNMTVQVYDNESATEIIDVTTHAFTNGAYTLYSTTWSAKELSGVYDYRVRLTAGSSSSTGVDIALEDADFWILAQNASETLPTQDNSQTFNYTGTVQTFTVPDNVTEVTIVCLGGSGAGGDGASAGAAGLGGSVTATFTVVPGTVYDVYVGGVGSNVDGPGGWLGGGNGGNWSTDGGGGGGASFVVATGGARSAAIICAGGGGGGGGYGGTGVSGDGGGGGLYAGIDGEASSFGGGGGGATQFAAGAGGSAGIGSPGEAGDVDGLGYGGDANDGGAGVGSGGGGGGFHGGGGGGGEAAGGGGGSGYVAATGFDIEAEDAVRSGAGQIVVSWDDPLEV